MFQTLTVTLDSHSENLCPPFSTGCQVNTTSTVTAPCPKHKVTSESDSNSGCVMFHSQTVATKIVIDTKTCSNHGL